MLSEKEFLPHFAKKHPESIVLGAFLHFLRVSILSMPQFAPTARQKQGLFFTCFMQIAVKGKINFIEMMKEG